MRVVLNLGLNRIKVFGLQPSITWQAETLTCRENDCYHCVQAVEIDPKPQATSSPLRLG
jgi:hypothetical protein